VNQSKRGQYEAYSLTFFPFKQKDDVAATGFPLLLRGVAGAWGVWCNVTGELACFPVAGCGVGAVKEHTSKEELLVQVGDDDVATNSACSSSFSGCWAAVCCNDNMNLVNYLVQGVGRDMYWPPNVRRDWPSRSYEEQLSSLIGPQGESGRGCAAPPGIEGFPSSSDAWSTWLDTLFGGLDLRAHSNLMLSNGLLDPWSAAGVYAGSPPPPGPYTGALLTNVTASGSVQSLVLDLGAHHLDLMFMDDADPPCAAEARAIEADAIRRWAAEDSQLARAHLARRSASFK